MLIKLVIYILVLATSYITLATELDVDIETNNIYCQMNEFFKLRIQQGQTIFTCNQQ